jgi:signal transduction histidine kinase
MLKSIRSRLIVSYLLVVLLAMSVAAALAWSALDRAFLDVLRENLLAQARRVAQTVESSETDNLFNQNVEPDWAANTVPDYPARIIDDEGIVILGPDVPTTSETLAPSPAPELYSQVSNVLPGYHTRVIDDEGVVILGPPITNTLAVSEDTQSSFPPVDNEQFASNMGIPPLGTRSPAPPSADLLNRSEIQSAMGGEPATEVRSYDWAPQRRILYAAYPVRSLEGDVTSVVYIASPLPRLTLSLLPGYFGPQALGGATVAILLAGLAGVLLARQLTRPLRQLTEATSALARGESAPPIPPTTARELHALGVAFNTMNVNLTAAHNALAAQARQREAILESLADAVLAANGTGEIVLTNPAGSALLAVAPQPLRKAIRHTLASGERHATEIAARDQVIELLTTPLRDEDGHIRGAVAVAHDVTAYRQLDRLRTNFVSDVSHELRTPLTAIKGFVETLQESASDDPAARDRFLRTVAAETDRLIRLTNDLLLLTRADAGRLDLQFAHTDLVASARRAAAQLEGPGQEKGITLTIEPPDEPVSVLADADRIHQVLVNLLDNGIKFTPARGWVSISFERAGEWISCTVTDTGPGIPAKEIPYIFERFYRGDRARARAGGKNGSGLGLAIAKAIVEAHGSHLWVESKPNHGTHFTFTLPAAP